MKQMVFGLTLTAILGIFIALILTVQGRNTRQNELSQSIDSAMKTAMEQAALDDAQISGNQEAFMAVFLESLLVQCSSDSDITVNVLELDLEKGLFSVEVKEAYLHPNGKEGTVSVTRTVILDQEAEDLKGEETL